MTLQSETTTKTLPVNGKESIEDTFSLTARDITGTAVATGRFQRNASTSAVAKALATRMLLPQNTPWTLRDSQRGQFLDEQQPIGTQVGEGAQVDVVPKVHLGGHHNQR